MNISNVVRHSVNGRVAHINFVDEKGYAYSVPADPDNTLYQLALEKINNGEVTPGDVNRSDNAAQRP